MYSTSTNKILKQAHDKDGYKLVCLHTETRKETRQFNQSTIKVSRLVLISFDYANGILPENFAQLFVNHKNSDISYNYLWNLEWTTPKENTIHGIQYGYYTITDIIGENNPCNILSESQIYEIYNLLVNENFTNKDISRIYNVSESTINSIANGITWKHLNLDLSKIRISRSFTNEEINKICEYFETHDINNKSLYKNPIDLFRACFYELGLYNKYKLESKIGTLTRLLYKSRQSLNVVANNYNYEYIR